MNQQLKTVLLTVLTLSAFVIALVELSGVSKTALLNKFDGDSHHASTAGNASDVPKTKMDFDNISFDFGKITEGAIVTHSYRFTNTGDNPLIISNAVASCGCTVPSYPKEPISPGSTGEIVVQFNSSGKSGHQHKNILIQSNALQPSMSVGFDAEVQAK